MPLTDEQRESIIAEITTRRARPLRDLSDEDLVAIIQRGQKLSPTKEKDKKDAAPQT